jgi:2-methylcitrate dehydratase PrpD
VGSRRRDQPCRASRLSRFAGKAFDRQQRSGVFQGWFPSEPVTVEYPIGHRRRRKEGVPALLDKFEQNLRGRMPARKADAILKLFCDRAHLEPPPWIA